MQQRSTNADNVIQVTDLDDPRLADYRDIRDRGLLGPEGLPGLFIVEQPLVVKRMLSMPGITKSVLVLNTWADRIAPFASADIPVYVTPMELMTQVAG